MNRRLSRFARLALIVLLALQAGLAWPMSQKKEEEIGKKMYDEIVAKMPIYENPPLQDYIARIGQELVKHSDMPDRKFTFTLLDSEDINAFAIPGGYIFVYRGLLGYLESEAELAAVLGHEIAHVTERHASRQDWMSKGSSVASALLGIFAAIGTGSGQVGSVTQDAASMMGTAMVRGYGRDMELEADRVGARYMNAAGYDTAAMVEVLSALKEQEIFMNKRARAEGKQPATYHGVFSTHPRNDQRLKEVVTAARKLEASVAPRLGAEEFRRATENMKFFEQERDAVVVDNRYFNNRLGFTVSYPTDWKVVRRSSVVLSGPNRDNTILKLSLRKARTELSPRQFAEQELKAARLAEPEEFEVDKDIQGFAARAPDPAGGPDMRIGVIYYASTAYVFEGRTRNAAMMPVYDALFMASIRSFRPMSNADRNAILGINIHYMRAPEGISFARLAEVSPVEKYAEDYLRLVNGYYPAGEPKPGEWIKVFR